MIFVKYKDPTTQEFRKLDPTLINVEDVIEELDTVNSFSFSYPATEAITSILDNKIEMSLWEDEKHIITGRLLSRDIVLVGRQLLISFEINSFAEEFAYEYTPPNYAFHNEQYVDILNPAYPRTLIRPNTGWETTVEPTNEDLTYLSSFQKTLRTYELVRQQIGYHWREVGDEINPRKLEFGLFEQDSGVRVRQNPKSHTEIGDGILLIDELEISEDTQDIINWLYVLGGGGNNGLDQLSLRDVDPAIINPLYQIKVDTVTANDDTSYDNGVFSNIKTGSNNNILYYIEDVASQTELNGAVLKVAKTFKDIYPIPEDGKTYTDQDKRNAANELYKRAVQELTNNNTKHMEYNIRCFGDNAEFKVGDTINLKFKGKVKKLFNNKQSLITWVDIDEDLIVIEKRYQYSEKFMTNNIKEYDLVVSNFSHRQKSDLDTVRETVDAVNDSGRQRKGTVAPNEWWRGGVSIDSTHPAKYLFRIPEETIYADYILLKLRLDKFRAYSLAGAGESAHTHNVTIPDHVHTIFTGNSSTLTGPAAWVRGEWGSAVGNSVYIGGAFGLGGNSSAAGGATVVASAAGSNHTHAPVYGIFENPAAFSGVKIFIDGIDYSSELGSYSSTGDFPAGANDRFDIMLAASNLSQLNSLLVPGDHTIEVRVTSGLVLAELTINYQFYLSSR